MKDKYYTPSIEEFRVGFRYEFLENHGSPNEKWVSKILENITDGDDDIYLGNTLKALQGYDRVFSRVAWRVKYLDEEDILSLGFIKARDNRYQRILDNDDFYEINYDEDDDKYTIEFWKKNSLSLYDCFTLFRGQVKNINELEVILKQVGI